MATISITILAAFAEIAGCFAFWAWLRSGLSPLLALAGLVSLTAFALLLTRIDSAFAGRAFAGYGGIYILASLVWMGLVEGQIPDRWDALGAGFCIIGALIILFGPRSL